MCARTGFWTAADGSRVLWARDNGSDKRSELWELRVDMDGADGPVYEWVDVSPEFREYGFAGYLAVLRFQGYALVQQPNAHTRNLIELPKLPYPSGMVAGSMDVSDGWEYVPAVVESAGADSVARSVPAVWRINVADYRGDDSDIALVNVPGMDGWDPRDFLGDETFDGDDEIVEPAAETMEIPEIPAKTSGDAVVYVTMPDMMTVRECPALQGLDKVRSFRTSQGRKVAYVAVSKGVRCVIAYRSRYRRGSDPTVEQAIKEFAAARGFALTA